MSLVALCIIVGRGAPAASAQPLEPPESFSAPAAAATAASIMIYVPDDDDGGLSDLDLPRLVLPDVATVRRNRTLSAGVIVDASGIALTSARAVLGAPEFKVVSGDQVPLEATVLAVDRKTDIAVLKLRNGGGTFPYLRFGDSQRVALGDWVIAVGAPQGFPATVTAGVITAVPSPGGANPLGSLLQTDALKGRGNLGAAIVNLQGEMVGLGTGLGDDAGYARPSTMVRKVYLELLEKGRVSRPWLGVTTQSLRADLARALRAPDETGVLITDVLPGGPAAGAGLRGSDIVLAVDKSKVSSRAQLDNAVNALAPGRAVTLTVRREGRVFTARLTLAEEPEDWRQRPALMRVRRLFGIEVEPLTPTMGAVVVDVEPLSSAAFVGLESGDIIREVNRRSIRTIGDFQSVIPTLRADTPALLLIQRGDVALYVVLTAEE